MNPAVRALMGKVERESYFARIAPSLHVGANATAAATHVAPLQDDLARSGTLRATGLLRDEEAATLAAAIEALEADGVPALFIYAYDEAWDAGTRALAAIREGSTSDYRLMRDVWAWRIPAKTGHRGWRPHRGTSTLDLRDGTPSLVNVWVALTDVSPEEACMHVVPLSRDPHYPHALDRIDACEGLGEPMPARRGELIGWRSNVLHWGGPMTARARGPRVSMSFSLRLRAEASDDLDDPGALGFRERLDLIAQMLATYSEMEGPALDAARAWSSLTLQMRALGRR